MVNKYCSTRKERRLSAFETIQVILSFGMFTISLIALVVKLLKDKK